MFARRKSSVKAGGLGRKSWIEFQIPLVRRRPSAPAPLIHAGPVGYLVHRDEKAGKITNCYVVRCRLIWDPRLNSGIRLASLQRLLEFIPAYLQRRQKRPDHVLKKHARADTRAGSLEPLMVIFD